MDTWNTIWRTKQRKYRAHKSEQKLSAIVLNRIETKVLNMSVWINNFPPHFRPIQNQSRSDRDRINFHQKIVCIISNRIVDIHSNR